MIELSNRTNMSNWTVYLLFLCLVLGVQTTGVKEYQDEVPGHEGQCMGKDHKFYKLGEKVNDEPCVRKICKGTAAPGSVYLEVERCANVEKMPGCQLKSDAKKSYPDCCTRLECKN